MQLDLDNLTEEIFDDVRREKIMTETEIVARYGLKNKYLPIPARRLTMEVTESLNDLVDQGRLTRLYPEGVKPTVAGGAQRYYIARE